MGDLIDRQAAIDAVKRLSLGETDATRLAMRMGDYLERLASAQPEVTRCKNCRWWDKYNDKHGYCMAAKHGFMSSHWEISIYRTYDEDFFCADAEPKQEGAEDS